MNTEILWYIVMLLLAAFVCFTLLIHCFTFVFLFIEHKIGRIRDPAQYPAITIRRFIMNFLTEYCLVMSKYILLPYKYIDISNNLLQAQQQATAILLVHGFARHQSDWLWFIKYFSKKTNKSIFTVNLSPILGPIQQLASKINDKIIEIMVLTQCKNIILIGHSMGGLVASYYSEYLDQNNYITKVITLGTPFYGTKIAVAASGANVKQMEPENQFLAALREQINNSNKQYFNIATQIDNLIYPWQSCLLANNLNRQKIYLSKSHLGLIFAKDVVNQVSNWVN